MPNTKEPTKKDKGTNEPEKQHDYDEKAGKKVPSSLGSIIYQLKTELKNSMGEKIFERLAESCSPTTRDIFLKPIFSNQWYPDSAVAEILNRGFEQIGKDTALKLIRESTKNEMSTVLKLLLRLFISPQKFAENNKKLWDTMHNTGNFKVTVNEPKTHTLEISEFDFINEEYELAFMEYHSAVLELAGAKNVRYTCIKTKDRYVIRFIWD